MNKHEALKAELMGQPIVGASDLAVEWTRNHQPLLSPQLFTDKGRRLNRFCVGSDPEFAIERAEEPGHRYEAAACGLHVGLAVGADQNERLVELRPWPSTSVVEHVAGILSELRWLYRTNGTARANWWRAGAYFCGDGMGGHVHFGRKRPTREEEVAALDGLAVVMRLTGLFPEKEWKQRTMGDRYHNAPYGKYGDFRVQAHGYEYRTLPSWLQSPKIAFIVVTLSKLAVIDPEITKSWIKRRFSVESAKSALRGLAKLYKGRDDDAYLLYHLLTVQGDGIFVLNYTADFKVCWGIPRTNPGRDHQLADATVILPSCIRPTDGEKKAVLDHLLLDLPIDFVREPKTFRGEIPDHYCWLPKYIRPNRRAGFGDLIHNLVTHESLTPELTYGGAGEFVVMGRIPEAWSPSEARMIRDYHPRIMIYGGTGNPERITIPRDLCKTGPITGLRTMLLNSGLFPIWTVDTVQPDSYQKWVMSHPPKKTPTWRTL